MKKKNYRISKEAIEDLDSIWIYTYKNWSKEQADRYFNLVLEEIEYLSNNYMSGRSIEEIRKNYRVSKVKSHLIFYRITDTKIIEVIRILHQKMDVQNHLK